MSRQLSSFVTPPARLFPQQKYFERMVFNNKNSASKASNSYSKASNSFSKASNATTSNGSVLSNFSALPSTVDMSNSLNTFPIFEFQEKTAVELAVESALEFTFGFELSGRCGVANDAESFYNYTANGYEISMENAILYTCDAWSELLMPASYSDVPIPAISSPSMNSSCTLVEDLDYTHGDDDFVNVQKRIKSIKTAARVNSKRRVDRDVDLVKLKNNNSAKKCYAKKKQNLENFKSICLQYLNDLSGRHDVESSNAYIGFKKRYNDIIMSLQPLKPAPSSPKSGSIISAYEDSTDSAAVKAANRRARGTQSASRRRLAKKNATAHFDILAQDLTAYFKIISSNSV